MILYHGSNVEFDSIDYPVFFRNRKGNQIVEKAMSELAMMKMDMVKNLALLLMEQDASLSMEQALSIVFNSDTYQKVLNEKTKLYYQSPRYVFSFLESELTKGKME